MRKYLAVIRGALTEAVRDGAIERNILSDKDALELPSAPKFEGHAYTAEQVLALFRGAEESGEPLHAAVVLGACYGLRRSEICGLRWSDVDFAAGELHVRNTVVQNGSTIYELALTKTDSSRRDIKLIESTVFYLHQLRESQLKRGLELGKVCRWPDGRAVQPTYLTHHVPKLMDRCGLPRIRLHDLRHTAASLLIASKKATIKQVQEFLGHSDVSTTMDVYTHLLDEDRRATSDIMDSILSPSCSESCSERVSG